MITTPPSNGTASPEHFLFNIEPRSNRHCVRVKLRLIRYNIFAALKAKDLGLHCSTFSRNLSKLQNLIKLKSAFTSIVLHRTSLFYIFAMKFSKYNPPESELSVSCLQIQITLHIHNGKTALKSRLVNKATSLNCLLRCKQNIMLGIWVIQSIGVTKSLKKSLLVHALRLSC